MKLDIGLLILRVFVGLTMLWQHGWGKLSNFATYAEGFPDPFMIGSKASLGLAVFAEFFCSLLLILGFATRLAATPLLITMLVAGLVIHSADPFQKKELALLYAAVYLFLILAGGGKYGVDVKLGKKARAA